MTFKFWFTAAMLVLFGWAIWPLVPEAERFWLVVWTAGILCGAGTYDIWSNREEEDD